MDFWYRRNTAGIVDRDNDNGGRRGGGRSCSPKIHILAIIAHRGMQPTQSTFYIIPAIDPSTSRRCAHDCIVTLESGCGSTRTGHVDVGQHCIEWFECYDIADYDGGVGGGSAFSSSSDDIASSSSSGGSSCDHGSRGGGYKTNVRKLQQQQQWCFSVGSNAHGGSILVVVRSNGRRERDQ